MQQHHEHVDEVQVQAQSAHDTGLLQPFLVTVMCMRQVSVLDVLRVIGGKASENQNADSRDREHKGRGGEEDVHDRRNNQANDAHDQEATPARDVLFRGVAPKRQPRESDRSDQENLDDGIARKDQKDRADRNAHDGSENIEQCLRSRGRDFIHRGTQAEDKRQRCKHHNPFQPGVMID